MECTYCKSDILADCHYCPVCGKPTALSAEASAERLAALSAIVPVERREDAGVQEKDGTARTEAAESSHKPVSSALAANATTITLDPKTIHTLLAQANLFRLRRQWEEATEQCIGVLRADPGNQAAHSLLGDIYRDQNKFEDAIRWYQMAVDLQPNAADDAKLRKLEQARDERNALAERRGYTGKLPEGADLAADGTPAEGTATLMSISPRRWLRGITVVSLAFLSVVLIVLIQKQIALRGSDSVPRTSGTEGTSIAFAESGSGNVLPPAIVGGASPGARSTGAPAPAIGGSGLAPDLRNSGVSTSPIPPAATTEPPKPAAPAPPNLPTAAVSGVRPLPPAGGGAVSLGTTGNALTGGMMMGAIHDDRNDGNATVIVLAQDVSAPGMRDHAIRNMIRAARTAFGNNSHLNRATVSIQTSANDSAARILLSADVERSAISQSDPEHDSLDILEHLLHFH